MVSRANVWAARYGNDVHYIQQKGLKVLASDISDVPWKEGKTIGRIDDFRKENAKALSFSNREFDFVCCKESFHHFYQAHAGPLLNVADSPKRGGADRTQ